MRDATAKKTGHISSAPLQHDVGWSHSIESSHPKHDVYVQAEAQLASARKRLEEIKNEKNSTTNLKLVGHEAVMEALQEEMRAEQHETRPPKNHTIASPQKTNSDHDSNLQLGTPITNPTDPRWVLALRTVEAMEGCIIRPEDRDKLIKMGKSFGLTSFDANLVIAILQDQARRGNLPQYCPQLAHSQLQLIPLPHQNTPTHTNKLKLGFAIASVIAVEIAVLWWLFIS